MCKRPLPGLCAPFCDADDPSSSRSCANPCPTSFTTPTNPLTGEDTVSICNPGAFGPCSPLVTDCGEGRSCYGIETSACYLSGTLGVDEPCWFVPDCAPGTTCVEGAAGDVGYCEPFCDPSGGMADVACDTLCPRGFRDYPDKGAFGVCKTPA